VLIEHPLVVEATVVPSPDPVRLAVPKAYVVLRGDAQPTRELALELFRFCRAAGPLQAHPPPGVRPALQDHQRQDPPRRAPRRGDGAAGEVRGESEFWYEDFKELRTEA
jgi:acetyl-CoA synthetase